MYPRGAILTNKEVLQRFIEANQIKYFRAEEFRCRHCGEIMIATGIVRLVDELRYRLGKPVVITSAYRCPTHNKNIGGVKNSAHTKGLALDIKCTNSLDRFFVVNFLLEKGVERIGVHSQFIHFDLDTDKPSPRLWLYGKKRHIA